MRAAELPGRWPNRLGLLGLIVAVLVVGSCWIMPGHTDMDTDGHGMPLSLCSIVLVLPAVALLIDASRLAWLAGPHREPLALALAPAVPVPPPRSLPACS